ncbi:hypothetical protein PRIPAC_72884 [Pristionchus pacificus]|uniref:Uncharacterized protein n=1 Tax=Pristionchus pacificus TaxID=54126 RepID=A0A2A6CGK1_PRIPA|nr:hypothetical protein PRIPAC_72884 [Pristionchus pacificus]|eukprot:PDM77193.1 hypothetical protein PRIPAC_43105 [Pristionchus pacificus]
MDDDYVAEYKNWDAMLFLLVETLFFASVCLVVISIFIHRLKIQMSAMVQQKEQAKAELTRLRKSVVPKHPNNSKAGPDTVDITSQSKGRPDGVLRSETPPYAVPVRPGAAPVAGAAGAAAAAAPAFDDDAPAPGEYKLAVEHAFIASVLASMAHPTSLPPPAPLPLTLYSPSEVPLTERDGTELLGAPTKLTRRSSASVSSDPAGASAGASGDHETLAGAARKVKVRRKEKKGRAAPAPSYDLVAAISRAAPGGHSTAPGPVLHVGPPPKKPKSEMAQSDMPVG